VQKSLDPEAEEAIIIALLLCHYCNLAVQPTPSPERGFIFMIL
jgi:hypothetical protein